MIAIPAELLTFSTTALFQAFVVFLRMGGAVSFLPAFGERMIPQRVKLAIAFAFTAIVMPAVPATMPGGDGLALLSLIATELLIGAVLGLTLRMMIVVLQMAGSMAAQSTSLAQIFGGSATEPMPAIGHLLVIGRAGAGGAGRSPPARGHGV